MSFEVFFTESFVFYFSHFVLNDFQTTHCIVKNIEKKYAEANAPVKPTLNSSCFTNKLRELIQKTDTKSSDDNIIVQKS